jgi:hypothetical protein
MCIDHTIVLYLSILYYTTFHELHEKSSATIETSLHASVRFDLFGKPITTQKKQCAEMWPQKHSSQVNALVFSLLGSHKLRVFFVTVVII